ncbi:ATP-grasp domain-containing protein [Cellulosimicrobium sp. TH-20]|uniref:ATP-grasp domain-containing protein n=1 Tax=Cellulosimicrobium sp. TH-20 TaxID=1980001 RepID=UPI001583244D
MGDTRTIIVTGAAGPAGRALGAQLARRPEVHAVGVDLAPRAVPGFATVEAVPAAGDPAYDGATLALVRRHGDVLVVPSVSEELAHLAVLAGAAGLTRDVVVSPPGPTAVAGDKLLTMLALDRQGVGVPPHAGADALPSAADALDWAAGPVVVKPRVARGGRGVHVVETADDPAWAALDASWIVQGFAPGREYCPQVFRSPSTGETQVVVLEKTGRKEGRVGNATTVTRLEESAAADVAAVARATTLALGLVGPLDMDVRRLADGTPVVLEVNARFGAVSESAPELLDAVLREWPV